MLTCVLFSSKLTGCHQAVCLCLGLQCMRCHQFVSPKHGSLCNVIMAAVMLFFSKNDFLFPPRNGRHLDLLLSICQYVWVNIVVFMWLENNRSV